MAGIVADSIVLFEIDNNGEVDYCASLHQQKQNFAQSLTHKHSCNALFDAICKCDTENIEKLLYRMQDGDNNSTTSILNHTDKFQTTNLLCLATQDQFDVDNDDNCYHNDPPLFNRVFLSVVCNLTSDNLFVLFKDLLYIRFKDAEAFAICCKMLYQIIEEIRNSWNSIRVPIRSIPEWCEKTVMWKLPSGAHHNWKGPALFYKDETCTVESYYVDGLCHRLGGPAFIEKGVRDSKQDKYAWRCMKFLKYGEYSVRKWYVRGVLHRTDKPARIHRYTDIGDTHEVLCWYKEGKLHREDGPAIVKRVISPDRGGCMSEDEVWCKNGLLHREDRPAWIETRYASYRRHSSTDSQWFVNGKFKRRISCGANGLTQDYTHRGCLNPARSVLYDIFKDAIKTTAVN